VGTEVDKNVPEANGVDNEDSINLTIGEDEEKLLAEEVGLQEFEMKHKSCSQLVRSVSRDRNS
jgi:hypothetical protein